LVAIIRRTLKHRNSMTSNNSKFILTTFIIGAFLLARHNLNAQKLKQKTIWTQQN